MASAAVNEIMNLNTEPMTHEDNILAHCNEDTCEDWLLRANPSWDEWDMMEPQDFEREVDALYYSQQSMYSE